MRTSLPTLVLCACASPSDPAPADRDFDDGGAGDTDSDAASDADPDSDSASGSATASDVEGPPGLEGYGTETRGGAGGETYHVDSLADSGPGTLRRGVENAEGPRTIVFDVAGEITLETDLIVRSPFLTIDGETAPEPGITIVKGAIADGEIIIAGTHDVIVRYLRIRGLYERGGPHLNDAGTIGIDGDSGPDHVAHHVVLDHVTSRNSTDSGPDVWGEVHDVTISWCLFFYSWHPSTLSHYPAPYQTRQRISMHHNVYARNGERNPQVRGDVRMLDMVNDVVWDWGYFGESSGYGVRIRNDPGEPIVDANVVANAFLPTIRPAWALLYGSVPGPDADDGGPDGAPAQGTVVETTSLGRLWVADNLLPPENLEQYSTVAAPLPIPDEARVTTWPAAELGERVLPTVGTHFRDDEEQALLDELAAAFPL